MKNLKLNNSEAMCNVIEMNSHNYTNVLDYTYEVD